MFPNGSEGKLYDTMLGRKEKIEKRLLRRVMLQLLLVKVLAIEGMGVTNVERVVIGPENVRRVDAVQEVEHVTNVERLVILPENVLKGEAEGEDSCITPCLVN